jgi:rSAM/selenodomain-associated transferase 2
VEPKVSLIVPVLADEEALAALLRQIPPDSGADIVVVDGGRSPGVAAAVAGRRDVRVIHAPRGRGRQMNAGAAAATGEWLLFLHADSRLPPAWLPAILDQPRDLAGGWFRFALDDPAWQARWIERGVALRVRLFRLPYGDQGIFVRRGTFERLGGYREIPLMEDVDLVRRLASAGPVVELPLALATSARRWRRDGWVRRSLRNLGLISLYFAGVPPSRLARWYSR